MEFPVPSDHLASDGNLCAPTKSLSKSQMQMIDWRNYKLRQAQSSGFHVDRLIAVLILPNPRERDVNRRKSNKWFFDLQ